MWMTIRKSGEALRTCRPSVRTSCGRRGSAAETRLTARIARTGLDSPARALALVVEREGRILGYGGVMAAQGAGEAVEDMLDELLGTEWDAELGDDPADPGNEDGR